MSQTAYKVFFLVVLNFLFAPSFAQQDIPLGEWRLHVSYNNIQSVSIGSQKIYAASSNGIIVVNKNDKSFITLDKLSGLTGSGISKIGFHEQTSQLVVAYVNGTFDVIKGNETKNFDPSRNTVLTGSKNINSIVFENSLAYLSTDYGVLIFDLIRSEIKETWRDLGPGGNTLKILETTFQNDSVFLATGKGIMVGDPDDNLLDFNKWKRFSDGELSGEVRNVSAFNNSVYAAINGVGIFKYVTNDWIKDDLFQNEMFSAFNSSAGNLILASDNTVHLINESGQTQQINDAMFNAINDVKGDDAGAIWVADNRSGLVTNAYGAFESILPNGPGTNEAVDLKYFNNRVYLVAGGYAAQNIPLQRDGVISYFENGQWNTFSEVNADINSISFSPGGDMFLGTFGSGVIERTLGGARTLYDESNSTLINANPPGRNVKVPSLHYATDGLWVANYDAMPTLHLLDKEKNWHSYSFPYPVARYPLKVLTDFEDNIWMMMNPEEGGGLIVFDKGDNLHYYLTENDGSGELPSRSVYSIALDRDGYVWAGTDAGVAYFYDEQSDAVKPIFENRFLLRDDKVTAIAVDGGNRKWMGTERGIWLIDPTGENTVANFTSENSPLLSDKIVDMEIHPITGEVFFATDKGVVSFRSDATESVSAFSEVKIFPNPVGPDFMGKVGISGLATDAVIKITDVSGKLLFQTQANGGTASWDIRDHQGRRVPTGIFLVFAIKADGGESMVGKIAVIN